jgi:hypothetical protein
MGGMGNWEIELEMEKISEMFWFHKRKCNHLLQAKSSILTNLLQLMLLKGHIWSNWQLGKRPN